MNEHLEVLARLGFAALAGGIVGWERKIRGKPVGVITNMLVCVGSTMLAIYQQLSFSGIIIYGFELASFNPDTANEGRIVAQIVSGIGFLGAGTIMRDRNSDSISGITTAATLWVMACLGIVIGSGYWFLSIVSTISIGLILFYVKGFVNTVMEHKKLITIQVTCEQEIQLPSLFSAFGLKLIQNKILKISNTDQKMLKIVQLKMFVPNYISIEKAMKEILQQTKDSNQVFSYQIKK